MVKFKQCFINLIISSFLCLSFMSYIPLSFVHDLILDLLNFSSSNYSIFNHLYQRIDMAPLRNEFVRPQQQRFFFSKPFDKCWDVDKYIPCDQLLNEILASSIPTITTTQPWIETTTNFLQLNSMYPREKEKTNYLISLTDLQYSSKQQIFIQQYKVFILIMFQILMYTLILLIPLVLIISIIRLWRQKDVSVYNQSNSKFFYSFLSLFILILNSDIFTLKGSNINQQQQENLYHSTHNYHEIQSVN
jgi:hypothetical protein